MSRDTPQLAQARPARHFSRAISSGWPGALSLLGLCFLLHAWGIASLPPIDRDEARFAEATRQMLTADSWRGYVVPVFDGRPRLNKPPLIYWLQAACVRGQIWINHLAHGQPNSIKNGLQQISITPYRYPSYLGAGLAVLVLWRIGRDMFRAQVGWLAAALLAACIMVMVDVRQARTDEVLLCVTCLAMWALWTIWRSRRESVTRWHSMRRAGLLWLAVGVGVMTKGPVTLGLVFITAITVSVAAGEYRWLWRLRPILGAAVLLLMVGPWVWLVGEAVGWDRFAEIVRAEIVGRSTGAMEGHAGPPGYHLLLLPLAFWPGSIAIVPALVHGFRGGIRFTVPCGAGEGDTEKTPAHFQQTKRCASRWQRLRRAWEHRSAGRDAELFCLAWLIPGFLAFELVATKLPHYVLPMYPALALLSARAMFSRGLWLRLLRNRILRAGVWGWALLSFLVVIGLPATLALTVHAPVPLFHGNASVALRMLHWALGLLVVAIFLIVPIMVTTRAVLRQKHTAWLPLTLLIPSICVSLFVLGNMLPAAKPLWLSSTLAAKIHSLERPNHTHQPPLAAAGYHEDSLVFLTEGRIQRISWSEMPAWMEDHPGGIGVIEEHPSMSDYWLERVATYEGFNYSNGKWVRVSVIRKKK